MRFAQEPPHRHGGIPKTGVLLVNLGTPSAPTPAAVRDYLREFLSDPRVVEIPRLPWWLILHLVILRTRPRASARKYAKVWTREGSPLAVYTEKQAALLRDRLAERVRSPHAVAWGMRYGEPAVGKAIAQLREQGCDRILVVPLYPQYSMSTTASVYDAVFDAMRDLRNLPALRLVKHFHDHPAYIRAAADVVRDYWKANGRPERLVLSFHGVPRFSLTRGDPYHCECQKTARLLAAELGLLPAQYSVTFQSRFGRAEWLQPYTIDTVAALGGAKAGRVDVFCPGFVADCLETLEEIGIENRAAFVQAGGKDFHAIPCLNDRPGWIEALATIVTENLEGWIPETWDAQAAAEQAAASGSRALALGAET